MGGDEINSSSLGEVGVPFLCLGDLQGDRTAFRAGDAVVALAREGYACSDGTLA